MPITFLLEEGKNHLLELSKLAEKDPEFFKYLQENDRELLDFDPEKAAAANDSDDDNVAAGSGEDESMEDDRRPVLTKEHLRRWQKALLEVLDFKLWLRNRMLTLLFI